MTAFIVAIVFIIITITIIAAIVIVNFVIFFIFLTSKSNIRIISLLLFNHYTAKTTYEDVFRISKRQLLPLFGQVVLTSGNCLGSISKTNQYRIFLENLAPFI